MKWIFRSLSMFVFSYALCLPSYANQDTYIYGVDNAKKIEGNAKKPFYIRAGSFSDKANAKRYQKVLRSKISYPVKFSYKTPFYLITIGPIDSAAKVRETANKILVDSKVAAKSAPAVKSVTPVAITKQKLAKNVVAPAKVVVNPELVKPVVVATPIKAPLTTEVEPVKAPAIQLPVPLKAAKSNVEPASESEPIHKQIYHQVAARAKAVHHAIFKDPEMGKTLAKLAEGKFVFTGGVGQQYPQFNSRIYINNNSGALPPNNKDLYTTKQNFQPLVLASIGYRMTRDAEWFSAYSLALQYQHNFSSNVGNEVLQYSDPAFYNYNSDWSIASDIFLAVAKLNVFEYGIISPYIHAGIGLSFNNAGNYSEAPTSGVTAPRVNPGFSSYTTTNFAYSLGAGVDFQVTDNIIVSAQYQYQNLGNVKSGNGSAAWSTQSLDLGTYTTNAVLLSVSYLI